MRTPHWASPTDHPDDIAIRAEFVSDYDHDTWRDNWQNFFEKRAVDTAQDMKAYGPDFRDEHSPEVTTYGKALQALLTQLVEDADSDSDILDGLESLRDALKGIQTEAESIFDGFWGNF